MPVYKLTNEYLVAAADKKEAIAVIQQKGSELLSAIKLYRVDEPKKGWGASLKKQLLGQK